MEGHSVPTDLKVNLPTVQMPNLVQWAHPIRVDMPMIEGEFWNYIIRSYVEKGTVILAGNYWVVEVRKNGETNGFFHQLMFVMPVQNTVLPDSQGYSAIVAVQQTLVLDTQGHNVDVAVQHPLLLDSQVHSATVAVKTILLLASQQPVLKPVVVQNDKGAVNSGNLASCLAVIEQMLQNFFWSLTTIVLGLDHHGYLDDAAGFPAHVGMRVCRLQAFYVVIYVEHVCRHNVVINVEKNIAEQTLPIIGVPRNLPVVGVDPSVMGIGLPVAILAAVKALYEDVVLAFYLGHNSFYLGEVGKGAKRRLVVNMVMNECFVYKWSAHLSTSLGNLSTNFSAQFQQHCR